MDFILLFFLARKHLTYQCSNEMSKAGITGIWDGLSRFTLPNWIFLGGENACSGRRSWNPSPNPLHVALGYGNTFQQVWPSCKPATIKGNHLFTSDRGNARLWCSTRGCCGRNEQVLHPEDAQKCHSSAAGCAYRPVMFLDSALGAPEVTLSTALCSHQQSGPAVAGLLF